MAHGRAGDGVDLVDLIVHLHHRVDGGHQAEGPDAVTDEVRRVLAEHDALAEAEAAEVGEEVDDLRQRVRARHQLEQPHVAHRVEEVGDEEVLAEVLGASLGHAGDRQAGGVRGHDRARLADLLDPREDLLLDVEPLHHDLDDPVALGHAVPVVLEVADLDQGQEARRVQQRRPRLLDSLEAGERQLVAEAWVDVQQQHWNPGVGEVGGDAGPHDAGPEDRGLSNLSPHGTPSRS